jgi:serine/threonine-protein kinase
MGVVYRALDHRLDKIVAVKIMTGELFGNRRALLRFKREAQAVALLRHPNVVGVHDFGELPAGGAFIVMDLVEGSSWRKHLSTASRLAPERIANWVEDLCSGVAAAHSSRVVHRDLKPENVMISSDLQRESALILDFGIAKLNLESEDTIDISISGAVIGTRSYMSPEQRLGQPLSASTDIYSIAVMTLETLSRIAPPQAGATREWADTALRQIVGPDSTLRAVFVSALADKPEARTKTADELARLLPAAIRMEKPVAGNASRSDDSETLRLGSPREIS